MLVKALKKTFPYTLPILTGYAFLGIAYGVLMNRSGLEAYWTLAMSSLVFAGALQFASISLLLGAFNPLSAMSLAILVNIRHIFYGVSMVPKYRNMGLKKILTIFMMADEAFSIQTGTEVPKDVEAHQYYFLTALIAYVYWNGFSIFGHYLGSLIPERIIGFDFVLTALFYLLFLTQWQEKAHRSYLSLGFFSSLFSLWIFGKQNFLLPSMMFILLFLFIKGSKDD
jgi:4-azaleucine resistance transporter AzlC